MINMSIEPFEDLQTGLSIIALSKSLTADDIFDKDSKKRNSGTSTEASTGFTPQQLAADLASYKEHFSKLRLSYVEQVTKEKFLRAIVGDPPQYVEQHENAALEAQILEAKEDLKAKKANVKAMMDRLESQGSDLSRQYDIIELQSEQLTSLPEQIANLESSIAHLRLTHITPPSDPSWSLSLPDTQSLLNSRDETIRTLDAQLETAAVMVRQLSQKTDTLQEQISPVEKQRNEVMLIAQEALRKKQAGKGTGDELEAQGRWLSAAETTLRAIS